MPNNILRIYISTVVITFILTVLWEFNIEPLFVPHLESTEERWKFVVVSVLCVMLALILPSLLAIQSHIKSTKAEKTVQKNQNQLQTIIDSTQAVIYLKDINGKYILINRKYENLFNIANEKIIGKTDFEIFPKEIAEAFYANDRKVLTSRCPLEIEEVAPHDDGPHTYISLKFPLYDLENNLYGVCGISTDITERKKVEEEISKLSDALECCSANAVITDTEGNIEYVNPTFSKITGYSLEEVLGKNPRILKSDETAPEVYEDLWKTVKSGKEWQGEFCNKKKNGDLFWEQASISPIKDNNGKIKRFIAVKQDITERKKTEEMLKKFSYEDALTGVANRRTFDNVLRREWNRALRYNNSISIIMIDIDYFKVFNDHYGHQSGDKCLQKVAEIMKNALHRSSDFIARYGGEEFSVILPATDEKSTLEIAENLRKRVESQKIPHEKSETGDFLTVSAGISTVLPVMSLSPKMLLKQADGCLYSAKHKGRNCVVKPEANMQSL